VTNILTPTLSRINFSEDNNTQQHLHSLLTSEGISDIEAHYSNGLSKYIEKITVEIVTDPSKCKALWNSFSPKKTLFQTWEFKKSFLDAYKYKPYFILIKNETENLALLPLWYDDKNFWTKVKHYCWFGSNWSEDNTFFVKDENYIPLLLYLAPSPIELDAIPQNIASAISDKVTLLPDDSKYIINLKDINSLDEYFDSLKKKKRYNLRRDIRKIDTENPKFIFNRYDDLDFIIKINKSRFIKDKADWEDPRRIQTFKNIINNSGKSYNIKFISIEIGGQLCASDIIATYNGTYLPLKGASNFKDHSGLGFYISLVEIEDAIKSGFDRIDFLQEDCGWKKPMMQEVPLFKYVSGFKT